MTRGNRFPTTSCHSHALQYKISEREGEKLYREILEWRQIVQERKAKKEREAQEERARKKAAKAKA